MGDTGRADAVFPSILLSLSLSPAFFFIFLFFF